MSQSVERSGGVLLRTRRSCAEDHTAALLIGRFAWRIYEDRRTHTHTRTHKHAYTHGMVYCVAPIRFWHVVPLWFS